MTLHDYLLATKTTDDSFARLVGVSVGAVRKWRYGERTPRPAQMACIREATKGRVTPNDFIAARTAA